MISEDLAKLQGRWSQVWFEENGVTDPPDTHGAPGAVMDISGRSFKVAVIGGETLIAGTFVLDGSVVPKRIDWVDGMGEDAGKTFPAIYELLGDHFEFAAADAGMARPENFSGGPGITIRSFVRI